MPVTYFWGLQNPRDLHILYVAMKVGTYERQVGAEVLVNAGRPTSCTLTNLYMSQTCVGHGRRRSTP